MHRLVCLSTHIPLCCNKLRRFLLESWLGSYGASLLNALNSRHHEFRGHSYLIATSSANGCQYGWQTIASLSIGGIHMRKSVCLALLLLATPLPAQNDVGSEEIIVTAHRREADDYDESIPVIGLRRTADFAIQEVTIAGDTRDPQKRQNEIYEMVRGAIQVATRQGNIELATGEMIVEPLTLANYRNLTLRNDSRPDSQLTTFLV